MPKPANPTWKRKKARQPKQTAEQWRKARTKPRRRSTWTVWEGIPERRAARNQRSERGRKAGTHK